MLAALDKHAFLSHLGILKSNFQGSGEMTQRLGTLATLVCFRRGPEFNSQPQYSSLQLSLIPAPGGQTRSSSLERTRHTQARRPYA